MTSKQNIIEHVTDQMQQGKLTAAQANVLMVQMEGVHIVTGKVPADVRKALNEAVRAGALGHIKKEGMKPEAYHHKNARARALEAREREYRSSLSTLSKILA